MRPFQTRRVAVIEVPHALRSALALSHDVLEVANRCARALGAPAPFEVVSLRPGRRLPRDLAAIVLPGTGAASPRELDAQLASEEGQWIVRTLARAHAAGAHVATSCAGVFFAAAAGVLEHRRATTSWFLAPDLARRHPELRVEADLVLVESGSCLTGGAALAHADVMLALVERWARPLASHCASYLLIDRRRSQRPYVVLHAMLASHPRLARAEAWIHAHLAERFSIAQLAKHVGLGERTFARLVHKTCGLSPIQLVQRLRVDAARVMIERGESFEAVAPRVGYGDASALRRVFRRHARPPARGDERPRHGRGLERSRGREACSR